uniref:TYR_PHOSPHATASE_2 domain-containing protein n=1 Tax=Macrostomum lignano TaxID=282301 RepID=A0A1I8G9F3_9PLAT
LFYFQCYMDTKIASNGQKSYKQEKESSIETEDSDLSPLVEEYPAVSVEWGDADVEKIEGALPGHWGRPSVRPVWRVIVSQFLRREELQILLPGGALPQGLLRHTGPVLALAQRQVGVLCAGAARSTRTAAAACWAPYSYDQTELMRHGISVYNLYWADYTCPSFYRMLDLVRVMQFALTEGRIAVHCHAGLGRTGLAIACLLVFSRRLSPALAIAYLRLKRPGSVQSHAQVAGVREFSKRIRILLVQWPDRGLAACGHRFSYEEHLHRQRALLHGVAARKLRRLSLLVHTVCTRLLQLSLGADRRLTLEAVLAATSELAAAAAPPRLDDELKGSYRPVLHCQDPGRLFRFLLCWLWELKAAAVTRQHISILLASPTITAGLGPEQPHCHAAPLLRGFPSALRAAGGQHAMDDLEGPPAWPPGTPREWAAATRHSPSTSASFLDFTECLVERPASGRSGPGRRRSGGCAASAREAEEEQLRAEEAREIAEKELPYGEAMALDGDAKRGWELRSRAFD